jgi:hypothetical protein
MLEARQNDEGENQCAYAQKTVSFLSASITKGAPKQYPTMWYLVDGPPKVVGTESEFFIAE